MTAHIFTGPQKLGAISNFFFALSVFFFLTGLGFLFLGFAYELGVSDGKQSVICPEVTR